MDPRMLVNYNIEAPAPNYPNRSFFLEKLIGYGAEGFVYQGKVSKWNNRVNDRVALKLQPKIKQDEINFILSLISIQNKCEQASNPKLLSLSEQASCNIIRVYEIIKWNNYILILMEAGVQNLNSYLLSEKNLTIQTKLDIMKQITQSILFLHQIGIIHRDIKPENFMQVGQQFKLIDFGLIRQNSELIKTAHVGTPLFASPEIFEETTHYTQSVDIWSLACVFYEIIQSQPLISGNTIEDVKKRVLNHKYQPEAIYNKIESLQVSTSLKSLLKQMLNPSPQKRCSIEEVLDQLQNIMKNDYQLGQQRDNPRLNDSKDNPQQQQFMNQSPFRQNKTDQNFFVFQNQNNQQQGSIQKNGVFPINNQQFEMQNFVKGGISQIQQILGTQVQQAQDQNRELIEQTISLTQQNKSLIELTEKNQKQIEYLEKKLFEKEKDDSKEKSQIVSNRSQCNCEAENKKLLAELQKHMEKENQSNLEQINKMNKTFSYFQKSIDRISTNLEEIKKQHNEEPTNSKNSQQQSTSTLNSIIGFIQNSEKNMQQSIAQLQQNIQSYQQILNKQIEKNEFDEFNNTQKNSNDNNSKMIAQIYKQNQQLNNNLYAEIISKFEKLLYESSLGIIQNLKHEFTKNYSKIADRIQNNTGQSQQQNTQAQTQVTSHQNRYQFQQNQVIQQTNQQEGVNYRSSNKQEKPKTLK
ncbi:unnamed protein product (macronuclear) [Paramecium tetraurelia]|uniref:Protein kinase domain-containing protein n=1 Tax=Paramecium tetraurelia TaxID=5888 RepID=A0DKR9_PARTE|nr:uncharacterized protein GSPATT00017966001 [Paramecium tetraurelia]CAK83636.1 unnamed protein product [Paramecium tetraurelia]|eukprot:XP_001451033.1 hypothetical protein (macronuclear) [Paramecium tetraurelia strain d4-2]